MQSFAGWPPATSQDRGGGERTESAPKCSTPMMAHNPLECRRALREIREIVAVARLDGAQMSEHEALSAIAAIAEWTAEEAAASPGDCGDLIAGLDALLGSEDLDSLDDHSAISLFLAATAFLQGEAVSSDPSEDGPPPLVARERDEASFREIDETQKRRHARIPVDPLFNA